MINSFLSQKLADNNMDIMDMYFVLNKKLDNLMDWLDVNNNMNKTSAYIHHVAHLAPLDADSFRDYNAMHSMRTKYNTIEGQYRDFDNIIEGIQDSLNYIFSIQNAISDAIEDCVTEKDADCKKFLEDQLVVIRKYKAQFILFNDKMSASIESGVTLQSIDNHIDKYELIGG